MPLLQELRWSLIGSLGRLLLWLWAKSCRIAVLGRNRYQEIRREKKPVIFLIWHGRILLAPYFFRRRGITALVSPSEDGEIIARIISRWGYHTIRSSSSHAVIKAWNQMKEKLQRGGEVIIVPDGPRGPDRKLKVGSLKLARETGAYVIPFTFSASRKKFLKSWDKFLVFYPLSRVVAVYGQPFLIHSSLPQDEMEKERQDIEKFMIELDEKADRYFD
ncbi:MAG: lysophospholipid acyltransferase family protein [Candidatus Aminicenantes bacterium]